MVNGEAGRLWCHLEAYVTPTAADELHHSQPTFVLHASQTAPHPHVPPLHTSRWPVFRTSLTNAQIPSVPHTPYCLSAMCTQDSSSTTLYASHSKSQVIQPGPQPALQPWPHTGAHSPGLCLLIPVTLAGQSALRAGHQGLRSFLDKEEKMRKH